MSQIVIPEGYKPLLNLKETQIAIKQVKDFFQRELAAELNLKRVSAPLFVSPDSGLNDNLNGVERPVSFGVKEQDDKPFEIVHSLAKWKRLALKRYNFNVGEGTPSAVTRRPTTFIPSLWISGTGRKSFLRTQEMKRLSAIR